MSVHIGTPVSAGSDDAAKEVPSGGPACSLECPSRAQVAESVGAHAKTKFASQRALVIEKQRYAWSGALELLLCLSLESINLKRRQRNYVRASRRSRCRGRPHHTRDLARDLPSSLTAPLSPLHWALGSANSALSSDMD